jgi:hypothetical protein
MTGNLKKIWELNVARLSLSFVNHHFIPMPNSRSLARPLVISEFQF